MAQVVEIEITGAKAIAKRLKALDSVAQSKALQNATRNAANVIRDKARGNAASVDDPFSDNDIEKNVVTRYDGKESRKTGNFTYRVGVLGGGAWDGSQGPSKGQRLRAPGGSTWYWPYIEFGHYDVAGNPVPAQPFMRTAMDEGVGPAIAKFTKGLDRAIDRALKKQAGG